MGNKLEVKNLHVSVEGKGILNGINLVLEKGKVYALMGPNGSGKSTLSNVIMGNPKYKIEKGKMFFDGKSIEDLKTNERAKKGLFVSFQYPTEVEGVSLIGFLRAAYNSMRSKKLLPSEFREIAKKNAKKLGIGESLLFRYLNQGFSGGEKKRSEILQLLVLNPEVAILDETDSGLDIDALKTVSKGINEFNKKKDKTVLLITHYNRILNYVKPDKIFVMLDGKIVKEGDLRLVKKLEKEGYGWLREKSLKQK